MAAELDPESAREYSQKKKKKKKKKKSKAETTVTGVVLIVKSR